MNTTGLTKQQIRVLQFIDECQRQRGVSPTLEEIKTGIGIRSRGGVHRILSGLRDRGRVQWKDKLQRSIVLIPDDRAAHTLPPDLQVKLEQYCTAHNERPDDILSDALTLHFDALESSEAAA